MIVRWLEDIGHRVGRFDFPNYGIKSGSDISHMLHSADPFAHNGRIFALMAENMLESYEPIMVSAENDDFTIINRYVDSNIVYGVAAGFQRNWLMTLTARLPLPMCTIMIDTGVGEAWQRRRDALPLNMRDDMTHDRFEMNIPYQQEVHRQYKALVVQNYWYWVDGNQSRDEVFADIKDARIRVYRNVWSKFTE